jgi:hypothetical protein
MSALRHLLDGRLLIMIIGALVIVGTCIHEGNQYATAAPRETVTTTQSIDRHYRGSSGFIFNNYYCDYSFNIDRELYSGRDDCPEASADDSAKGSLWGSAGNWLGSKVPVHYDPSNPSLNSLTDFNAASERSYRNAASSLLIGVLATILAFLGVIFAANEKRGKGGIMVDNYGTVIYPEELDIGPDFDGPSGVNRSAEESFVDAQSEAAPISDSTHAPRLRELYLEVVKHIHPDRASDEADRTLRERLMKEANVAYKLGYSEMLVRILEEYRSTSPAS